ncbi:MAG: hypothetical protein ACOC7T_04005 [Planctomycetota bacterium]
MREQDGTWVVEFLSEPRTSPQPLWFHLRCRSSDETEVRFEWVNADSCLGLGRREDLQRVRPVLRADDAGWRRTPAVGIEQTEKGAHRLVFSSPGPCRRISAAFCYPYGPSDLRATLEKAGEAWKEEVIGLSGHGRLLQRLHSSGLHEEAGCYVLARQHAGETPGSWVLDGLLRAVAEADSSDPVRGVDWWVVPFMDLDGVVEGDYGKDAMPRDFNRAWTPMPMRPEVMSVQQDLRRFRSRAGARLLLDLHGPGGAEKAVYHFLPRNDRPRAHREAGMSFTSYLAGQLPEQDVESIARVPTYPSRWSTDSTASTWVWDHLDETLGICIETTYQGLEADRWMEPADYRRLGGRFARAAAEWLLDRR